MDVTYTVQRIVGWQEFIADPALVWNCNGFYILQSPHVQNMFYVGKSTDLRRRMQQRLRVFREVGVDLDALGGCFIFLLSCHAEEDGGLVHQVELGEVAGDPDAMEEEIDAAQQQVLAVQEEAGANFHIAEVNWVPGGEDGVDAVNLEDLLIQFVEATLPNDATLRNEAYHAVRAPNMGLAVGMEMAQGLANAMAAAGLPLDVGLQVEPNQDLG